MLIALLANGALAQAQVQGFSMDWGFSDANGSFVNFDENACAGDVVYLINRSLKNRHTPNHVGSPISSNSVTVGTYRFWVNNVQIAAIPAASWGYNDIYPVTMGTAVNPFQFANAMVQYTNNNGNVPGSAQPGFPGAAYEYGRIVVAAKPIVSIASSSILSCPGESVTLTASGGSSWQWNNGATGNSIVVSPSVTTRYTVTGTNSAGCSATASINVNVIESTIPVNREYVMCGRNSPNICPFGATPATRWYRNAGVVLVQEHVGACFSPTQPGNYQVITTHVSASGATCNAYGSFTVTQLAGQLNPVFGITTIPFANNYSVRADAVQTSFPPNVPGIGYWWQVEDLTTGCTRTNYQRWWGNWYPTTANGFTNNFPEFGEANCTVPYTPYASYGRFEYRHEYKISRGLWSDCDGWSVFSYKIEAFSGKNKRNSSPEFVITPLNEEEISAMKSRLIADGTLNANGPTNENNEVREAVPAQPEINIFPNPNNGVFQVSIAGELTGAEVIQVMDVAGRIVLTQNLNSTTEELNLSQFDKGVYFLQVINGLQTMNGKVIVD